MIRSAKLELGAYHVPLGLPKVTHKTDIPIRHNIFWPAIKLDNIVEIELGGTRRVKGLGTWDEMSHFRETVDHHKIGVVLAKGAWQTDDKIHADVLPRTIKDREGGVKSYVLFTLFG